MATKNSLRNKKVLITCGPTWVAIDQVRVISNISSGELGNILASALVKKKAKVTLVQGPTTYPTRCRPHRLIKFFYYDDLSRCIKRELKKKYDVVIHAAAVSDYQPAKPNKAKLSSKHKRLKLSLVSTKKIINSIKKSSPQTFLVGFKLLTTINRRTLVRQAQDLCLKAQCDLVVVNTLSKTNYRAYIVNRNGTILDFTRTRKSLAYHLIKQINDLL